VSLGPTSERLLALWQSGELTRAAEGLRTQHELAAKLGFTEASFRTAAKRLRIAGHAVPRFIWGKGLETGAIVEAGEFEDEPTNPAAPPLPAIPSGHFVKGVSTLVGADGETKGQWIKTAKQDEDGFAALVEALGQLAEPWRGMAEPIDPPLHSDEDLLCVFPLGDPHFGLLSWDQDAGENFDLKIAERNLCAAVDHLVSLAPPAKHALIISVGDLFHSDGQHNTTTKGTRVDVDGRTPKMFWTVLRTFRRLIEKVLQKHAGADVMIVPGNHDALLSLLFAIALSQFYENEPRVRINTSPELFQWHRFGANLIGVTHGDKLKPIDMLGVMATDRAADWSDTKHRRFYCGHIHHEVVKEVPGVTVEYLRTLAGSDAWHRGQGYRSGRDMKMDVFHREHGLINRHIVGIEQLRAR
jgi:UDP-2,3-diacylglucosamine pyrophosphatase LpxH